jgi:hypothetical protein
MHDCPAEPCGRADVSDDYLMCRRHWYMVPKPLRTAVWTAYQGGGVGSPELLAAQVAAINAVNRALAAEPR